MASRRPALRRRVGVAFLATGTAMATAALTLLPSASASSHREAPLIANLPAVDNTDVYAFTSPDAQDTVTVIANWAPFSEPNGGPNFYPWAAGAHYDINIDSDGDALPNQTYRWIFETQDLRGTDTFLYNNGPVESLDDENLLFRQTYDLIVIDEDGNEETLLDDADVAPSNVGPASMPDYQALVNQATVDLPGGGKSFTGQADDAFFLDLRVFDLLYGGDLSEIGQDTLAGYNTNTIALQVPKSELALSNDAEANPVIGVWSDTEQQTLNLAPAGESELTGDHVQISRLGQPLVNEVVIPTGLKDAFNGITPAQDADIQPVVDRVLDPEVPKLVEAIYGIPAPAAPRNDIFEIFLTGIYNDESNPQDEIPVDLNSQLLNTDVDPEAFRPSEMTRLNMSIPVTEEPNRLGVLGGDLQGFPNGRRLTDDVVDIEIQALEGAVRTGQIVQPLAGGDAVDVNDVPFLESFPYVGTAQNEGVNVTFGGGEGGGAGAVPPGSWISFPSAPVVSGVAALALLGAGVFMLRRRPGFVPARGNTVPVTE
ncbi:MAG TPA: DUF4331 domain-containing protein [Pseudonocardiaceae bacterium]|nr:DUF4331 domain-containing protein [Pseudonocardiaceae bacterium]